MKKKVILQRPKKEKPTKPHAHTLPKKPGEKKGGDVILDNDVIL